LFAACLNVASCFCSHVQAEAFTIYVAFFNFTFLFAACSDVASCFCSHVQAEAFTIYVAFFFLPFCLLPVSMLPHASVVTCRRRLSQSEPCVLFRLVSTELLEGDFTLVPTPSIKRIRLHSPPRTRVLLHVAEYSAVSFFCQRVNAARQRLPLLFCNFSILFESMLRGRGF